ncbi:MAG: winged helix-turn-helix transcriptional regulator [Candidatus Bathyarchaeota archaeon]|nr:winged helix-turn-helix transcriptional regulator [Candidatus Bathyarchaeota archaeon]
MGNLKKRSLVMMGFLISVMFTLVLVATYSRSKTIFSSKKAARDDVQPFTLSATLSIPLLGIDHTQSSSFVDNTTRWEIYNCVKNNPGTHFRGICDNLGLSVGVVQYHLNVLTKAGLLSTHNDRRYKRYFESKRFEEAEMKVISALRRETAGKVLLLLSENTDPVSHKNIALTLDLSSQALSWQINHLRKTGFIDAINEGVKVRYFMNEETLKTVKQCLKFVGLKL